MFSLKLGQEKKHHWVLLLLFTTHVSCANSNSQHLGRKGKPGLCGPLSSRISRNLSAGPCCLILFSSVSHRLCFSCSSDIWNGRGSDWLSVGQLSRFGSLWRRVCAGSSNTDLVCGSGTHRIAGPQFFMLSDLKILLKCEKQVLNQLAF